MGRPLEGEGGTPLALIPPKGLPQSESCRAPRRLLGPLRQSYVKSTYGQFVLGSLLINRQHAPSSAANMWNGRARRTPLAFSD